MGVRFLTGIYDGGEPGTALVDSVTDTAFGPLFASEEHAQDFLDWLDVDARSLSSESLAVEHEQWRRECVDEESGDLKEDEENEENES